jgi:hypothetical protein
MTLLLWGMHPPLPLSPPELLLIGARSRIFLLRASRLISLCHSNNALIRESHQQMSQSLSHLEEREMRTSMGLETSSPQSTLLFLLLLWKTLGLGTATPMMMVKTTTMMRSKRSLSENTSFSFSLFWCLMPKGEKKFYLSSILHVASLFFSQIVI